MAKKKKDKEVPQKGSPAWMTTYGDMMTLLLCFFVLLVSMSTMEIEKFKAVAASLKGALSVLPFQEQTIPEPRRPRDARGDKLKTRRTRAIARMKRLIREKNLGDVINVREKKEGVHITIGEPALFDSGKSIVKPGFFPILDSISEIISIGTNTENIRVEGHTDNIPINNEQYKNNWELSIFRSLSVIRYIWSKKKIDPKRLRPVGCGEFHPVATNDTRKGRALNRRVEIYIDFSE